MSAIIEIGASILNLIPLVLAFYIPALFGTATWKERGKSYKIKALLWLIIGFGIIVAIRLMLDVSVLQDLKTIGISLVQIAAALVLASLTVYKLAD